MKKNKMMRLASFLLVATLLTTSMISGTFAKYVTEGSASDSARVAKWGVAITATGDEAFAPKYDDAAKTDGTKVVSAVGDDVLAPGTNGTLGGIKITGKPEVMVNVAVTADLNLDGWVLAGDVEYCPLVFTVAGEEIKMDENITTVEALEAAVEAKLTALSATNVPANTDLATDRDVTITWEWPFEGNDGKDTELGNRAARGSAATIDFECEATVTQVD